MMEKAIVKRHWSGDYTVVRGGWYAGKPIVKPFCVYVLDELNEIEDRIKATVGQEIEIIEVQNYAG